MMMMMINVPQCTASLADPGPHRLFYVVENARGHYMDNDQRGLQRPQQFYLS